MISRDEAYKTAFETWRFQVNSYWTRNSYFAVFEAAAAAGVWQVTAGHGITAALLAAACLLLTWIWWSNNRRTHEYVRFWWDQIVKLETAQKSAEDPKQSGNHVVLATEFEDWRRKYRMQKRSQFGYSDLIAVIPWLFGAGWVYLLIFNLRNVTKYYGW